MVTRLVPGLLASGFRKYLINRGFLETGEAQNLAAQIQQRMKSDGSLLLLIPGPGEYRQTQLDGGRVESIDGLVQLEPEVVVGLKRSGDTDEELREVGVDTPVACFVCMGRVLRATFPRMPMW